jgi:hypothetical protein
LAILSNFNNLQARQAQFHFLQFFAPRGLPDDKTLTGAGSRDIINPLSEYHAFHVSKIPEMGLLLPVKPMRIGAPGPVPMSARAEATQGPPSWG